MKKVRNWTHKPTYVIKVREYSYYKLIRKINYNNYEVHAQINIKSQQKVDEKINYPSQKRLL